jgi:hypothetical protein
VLTSAVDTWQTVNIWTKNVTDELNRFLTPNLGTTYETN